MTAKRRDVSAQEPPTPHLVEDRARNRLDGHAEEDTAFHRQTLQAPDHGSGTHVSKASFLRFVATGGGHDCRQEQSGAPPSHTSRAAHTARQEGLRGLQSPRQHLAPDESKRQSDLIDLLHFREIRRLARHIMEAFQAMQHYIKECTFAVARGQAHRSSSNTFRHQGPSAPFSTGLRSASLWDSYNTTPDPNVAAAGFPLQRTIHEDAAWHPSSMTHSQNFLYNLCDAHTLDTLLQQATQANKISREHHQIPSARAWKVGGPVSSSFDWDADIIRTASPHSLCIPFFGQNTQCPPCAVVTSTSSVATQRLAHPQEITHTLSPVPLDLSELFDYFFLVKFHKDNISVQYTFIVNPHTKDSPQVIRIATCTRKLQELRVMFGRSDNNVNDVTALCLNSVKHSTSHFVTTRVSSIYFDLTVLWE